MADLNNIPQINFVESQFNYKSSYYIDLQKVADSFDMEEYGTFSALLAHNLPLYKYPSHNIVIVSPALLETPNEVLETILKCESVRFTVDRYYMYEYILKNTNIISDILQMILLDNVDEVEVHDECGCIITYDKSDLNNSPDYYLRTFKSNYKIFLESLEEYSKSIDTDQHAVKRLAAIAPAMKKEFAPNSKADNNYAEDFEAIFKRIIEILPEATHEKEMAGESVIPIDLLREKLNKESLIKLSPNKHINLR